MWFRALDIDSLRWWCGAALRAACRWSTREGRNYRFKMAEKVILNRIWRFFLEMLRFVFFENVSQWDQIKNILQVTSQVFLTRWLDPNESIMFTIADSQPRRIWNISSQTYIWTIILHKRHRAPFTSDRNGIYVLSPLLKILSRRLPFSYEKK